MKIVSAVLGLALTVVQRLFLTWIAAALCLSAQAQSRSQIDVSRYQVKVDVNLQDHSLRGAARIQLDLSQAVRAIPFEINSRFSVTDVTDEAGRQLTTRFDEADSSRLLVGAGQPFAPGSHTLQIGYEGTLEREDYAFLDKNQSATGYIGDEAAYLMFSARWFPVHDPLFDPATAEFSVTVPLGFSAVVAGTPKPVKTQGITEVFDWEISRPSNQWSLVIGKLREQKFAAGQVPVHVFTPDRSEMRPEAVTQQLSAILTFFQKELPGYPFGDLTLVEIPGDVRDEMAGPGVIYLPAEMLQGPQVSDVELARRMALQWWGLGVLPQNPQDVMLSDGAAFYLAAKYLESRNKEEYQDEILKLAVLALKYENRSSISNAFSLGFRSEEYQSIVGGKGAWVLYMLEDIMGRDQVLSLLKEFAAASLGRQALLSDLKAKASSSSGQDLQWFFAQWIETTGVPDMEVDYTVYKLADGGFRIAGTVKQNLDLFRMPLRVAVETEQKREMQTVQVEGKTTHFDIKSATRPVRVVLDPEQKLLRNSTDMEVAVHIALGYELFHKNQFLEAIREYERAIKLNPRSSLAHYRLGEVFFEQANTQSGGNAFRDALNGDLQPKWVESMSHLHLGKIYDMLGERQRALAEYQRVINAKDNTFGAVDDADKYSKGPFTKKSTVMDRPER
ncbi:MAG: tetratricopeptide repeat protein [Acidobacteria bacterium]|nr:tetratricopeptide repeat protein [Acidobacteriota bacterium]